MVRLIIKKILSYIEIEARMHSGDIVHIKLKLGDVVVLDRQIDIIKGV